MPSRRSNGGYLSHKPTCTCAACEARRRSTEAITRSTGKSKEEVEALKPAKRKKLVAEIMEPTLTTPGNTPRERVAQWTLMKVLEPSISIKTAAKKMGITDRSLHRYIAQGLKEKWLQFDDPMERLEYELIPKVVGNINDLLDKKDKFATMETAKATIFKVYQASHGASDAPVTVLALKIENTPPDAGKVFSGIVVGVPNLSKDEV